MTLPVDVILPEAQDFNEAPQQFVKDLIADLENMYENIANSMNGIFKNDTDTDGLSWLPDLFGSGAGSFTYTEQLGWVFRQGLLVDVWGQVSWSATTATGSLGVNLPYDVINANGALKFVGECSTSNITFSSGTAAIISANTGQSTASVFTYGSASALTVLNVPASGTLNFHLRYIGVANE